jgi:cysteinyl-tRNA synthetase
MPNDIQVKNHELKLYNSLTRKKELFEPLKPPYVGMYVCGPTLYSFVHLGNVRTFLTFDILFRYLQHLGYQVRYVRNITDVGHLVDDADEGEDKIAKKARLEQKEPMEIVQYYANDFHEVLKKLNFLPPSIEPTATGHIVEQIETVKKLLDKGLAYEANGSVYFDVNKYNDTYKNYGQLSGRVIDELITETRELEGTEEKQNPMDFALWKKAKPEHIMRWNAPWSAGFPGWHLECTCMSTKYLGEQFDIHGGGMDLKFPHHECEIAQAVGANGVNPVKYWLHSNMLTLNGKRMSKSEGNSILPNELFAENNLLGKAFTPMTFRFFALQSQYRSTLDITAEALEAARKGYKRLINGIKILREVQFQADENVTKDEKNISEIESIVKDFYVAMDDDLNTAVAIAALFNLLKKVHQIQLGQLNPAALGEDGFNFLKDSYISLFTEVLGFTEEKPDAFETLLETLLGYYKQAKADKDYTKVDALRAEFKKVGITIKDMKTGIDWAYEE